MQVPVIKEVAPVLLPPLLLLLAPCPAFYLAVHCCSLPAHMQCYATHENVLMLASYLAALEPPVLPHTITRARAHTHTHTHTKVEVIKEVVREVKVPVRVEVVREITKEVACACM